MNNPNMRKVVTVETRDFHGGSYSVEGVVLECNHWQKMPSGVVCDLNNATYRAFVSGERFLSCKTCARMRRESMRVPNVN